MTDKAFLLPADESGREKMTECILRNHPGVSSVPIARSILGRQIDSFSIGSGKRYVLILAAHHALESITANLAYLLIDRLLSLGESCNHYGFDCKLLLSKYRFIVVPCVNPDGIELRLHGASESPLYDRQMRMSGGDFTSWQANARGVDLNHNYDLGFFEYKKIERERGIEPGPTLYSGEYPESEPESRAIASLVRTLMPSLVVSLHSQGEEIYAFPRTKRVERMAGWLSSMTGYTLAIPTGTAAYTGLCDYTASLAIPSFTLEVGRGRNPLSEEQVTDVFLRTWKALVLLPTLL